MQHIVSFSGGRTSAYMVYLLEQKKKHESIEVEYIFLDTGAEDVGTYKFIKKLAHEWNIKITCLRAVNTPEKGVGTSYKVVPIDEIKQDLLPFKEYVKSYNYPYYPTGISCTAHMKIKPFQKYVKDNYKKGEFVQWIGIRIDEPRRLKQKEGIKYLADISDFTKQDIINWWSRQHFDLEIDEWRGNCLFCIHKKVTKLALVAKELPKEADAFHDMIMKNHKKKERDGDKVIMYEGGHNLQSIRDTFDAFGYSADELKKIMHKSGRTETGSCSESCEAILNQQDMFDD